MEYYDFVIYAYFATAIGQTFFPAHARWSQLALSIATFGFSLLARPLGALVLGRLADYRGRLPTLSLCVLLMGAGSTLMTLTPSYARIGLAAPLCVVVARLLHGFSLGGEFASSTSFLIEESPGHEARAASWQAVGQTMASFIAASVALTLSLVLPPAEFATYGFRIATGFGALMSLTGFVIRVLLRHHHLVERQPAPSPRALLQPAIQGRILAVMGMVALGSSVTYLGIYMPHYAQNNFHIPARIVFFSSVLTYGGQLALLPLRWRLTDHFDQTRRIAPMLASCTALALLPLLAFPLMNAYPPSVLLMPLLFNIVGLFYLASLDGLMGLVFPAGNRGRGLSLAYALGVVLFGGLAPVTNGLLISWTGNSHAPGLYVSACAGLTAIALLIGRRFLPEDRPLKTVES